MLKHPVNKSSFLGCKWPFGFHRPIIRDGGQRGQGMLGRPLARRAIMPGMFQFRLRTLMILMTLFCVIVGGILSVLGWYYRPGVVSFPNYERIEPGMTVAEVDKLLGRRGTEMHQSNMPQINPSASGGVGPAVVGDQYFRWADGSTYVIVSLRHGVVAEKYFWEPSL